MTFKVTLTHHREIYETPIGMWVVIRPNFGIEGDGWTIRVLNFATWKHRTFNFATEAEARHELVRWLI